MATKAIEHLGMVLRFRDGDIGGIPVIKTITHLGYFKFTIFLNDIALMKLINPIQLTKFIQPPSEAS